jgi:hypothetical protein
VWGGEDVGWDVLDDCRRPDGRWVGMGWGMFASTHTRTYTHMRMHMHTQSIRYNGTETHTDVPLQVLGWAEPQA